MPGPRGQGAQRHDHAHDEEPLGPIDVAAWGAGLLGVVAGLIVLLLLNAVVVSNATKDAYLRDDGARLVDTSSGTLQVLDQG